MYYITISNGLLEGDHYKKMGAAVWQFMWFIDKITRVDENGDGWVLGGKPIKLDEIAVGSRATKTRNISTLAEQGYISVKYAPYGIIVSVHKAKKRFSKSEQPRFRKSDEPVSESDEPGFRISDEPNKTVSKETLQEDISVKYPWLDAKAWERWVEYKKQRKQKLTDSTVGSQMRFLEKYKPYQSAIIDKSIMNGWTGLFPPKEEMARDIRGEVGRMAAGMGVRRPQTP